MTFKTISEAPSDAATVTASNSDFGSSALFEWASTFNSPSSPFNTVIYRNASADTAGDILQMKIYKGYIPDLGTASDAGLTDRVLDENNLMETVRVTTTTTSGKDYMFKFNTSFSSANLISQNEGDPPQFTAVIGAFASDGTTVVDAHRVLYDPRAKSAPIFTSPNDYGPDSDSSNGGAGNTSFNNNTQTLWSNSGSGADRSLAMDFYFEERDPNIITRNIISHDIITN